MSDYFDHILTNVADDGMTDDLWNIVYSDLSLIERLDIHNDRERNLLFYLENFYDDFAKEFDITVEEKEDILFKVFNALRSKEKVDLTDMRKEFKKVTGVAIKSAYLNTMGVNFSNVKEKRDVDKWISSLQEVYNKMAAGEEKDAAVNKITEGWSPMEKLDFDNWSKFYENGEHEKYSVKTAAFGDGIPIRNMFPQEQDEQEYDQDQAEPVIQKVKTEKTKEELKRSLISRLDSADKILREFVYVWPKDIWERLAEALSDLKRQVVLLRSEATIRDCIIRTANVWENEGFSEGASVLKKIAAPPSDVAEQVQKALSDKKEEPPMGDAPVGDAPPMDAPLADAPPVDAQADAMPLDMPPAGAGEQLPPPETPPAPETVPTPGMPSEPAPTIPSANSNPYVGKTIQDVVDVLEPAAQQLSERKDVRELTKADMMLDALNIASHFPELGEAIAKMIESTIYVHTRLEKVISKLKGGLREEQEEPTSPSVDMTELTGPTGPGAVPPASATAPNSNEKDMFEVTEEEPPK